MRTETARTNAVDEMRRATLNVTVAVGFLAVAVGTLIARANPATAYESSVYVGSPTITWVVFAFALAIAVGTTLSCRGRRQGYGIALGGTTVTAIVSLPVIRNYRFAGMGDAMTHLAGPETSSPGEPRPTNCSIRGYTPSRRCFTSSAASRSNADF